MKYVHCECAVLCHLDRIGQAMMPYIGISKSSCVFCVLFFAAYREHKGPVYAHGSHGRITAWKYPAFADNAEIKATFCEKLVEYIEVMLKDERERRRASMHSQRTVSLKDASESFHALRILQLRLTTRKDENYTFEKWHNEFNWRQKRHNTITSVE